MLTATAARARVVPLDGAPAGWESMYEADLHDDYLNELGAVFAPTLAGALEPFKALGFRCRKGLVFGTLNGREVVVTIWYRGGACGEVDVHNTWKKLK